MYEKLFFCSKFLDYDFTMFSFSQKNHLIRSSLLWNIYGTKQHMKMECIFVVIADYPIG
jgi:hypothetical protein